MANVAKKIPMEQINRLAIVHNALRQAQAPKPQYYLEEFDLNPDGSIAVVYINKQAVAGGKIPNHADWLEASISPKHLEAFTADNYSQANIFDRITPSGEHDQFGADINLSIYLEENLRTILLDYLNAGKEVQPC